MPRVQCVHAQIDISVHDQNLGEKVYFGLQAKAGAEADRRGMLLTACPQWVGPAVSTSNRENSPTDVSTSQSDRDSSPAKFPLSR